VAAGIAAKALSASGFRTRMAGIVIKMN
jgi:hypothetical protein